MQYISKQRNKNNNTNFNIRKLIRNKNKQTTIITPILIRGMLQI